MNLTTLGIDLAKTSFSLMGMDQYGKIILNAMAWDNCERQAN
jgi:hypothetical protein